MKKRWAEFVGIGVLTVVLGACSQSAKETTTQSSKGSAYPITIENYSKA